jgi:predicted Zn-dependent peptidase
MLLGRTATVARWTLLKEFVPKIQEVTREQIREVAKKYLVANNLTVGILVPIKSAKAPTGRSKPAQEIR